MNKKIIILFLLAAVLPSGLYLFSQETDDSGVSEEKSYPLIDETTLTFDEGGNAGEVEGTDGEQDNFAGASITVSDYLRMVFFLIIVIVIVWLFIKLLKRYSGNRFGDQELINVMGSQTLTAETSLHVVEVENRYYLLGASSGSVSLITEITDQETVDSLKLKSSAVHDREGKSFFEMLVGTKLTGPAKEKENSPSVDFLRKSRDRLKDL